MANGAWSASSDADWVALDPVESRYTQPVKIQVQANPKSSTRTAVVTIAGQTHTITQDGSASPHSATIADQTVMAEANVVAQADTAITYTNTYRLDKSFFPHFEKRASSFSAIKAPDGGFYVVGSFTSINGQARDQLAKFTRDGFLVASFNTTGAFIGSPLSASATARAVPVITRVIIQPDGKLLVAGRFAGYAGTSRTNLVRLNTDGTLDSSFNADAVTAQSGWYIQDIGVLSDGHVVLALNSSGNVERFLYLLNSDGSLNKTYSNSSTVYTTTYQLSVQADDKILVHDGTLTTAGSHTIYHHSFWRMTSAGTFDSTFNPQIDTTWVYPFSAYIGPDIHTFIPSQDGHIFVSGVFGTVTGPSTTTNVHFAKLNSNGSIDSGFATAVGYDVPKVYLPLDNGQLLVSDWKSNTGVSRLNADGTIDTSFSSASTPTGGSINAIATLTDGRIVVCGTFTGYGALQSNGIVILSASGALDSSPLIAPPLTRADVNCATQLTDGKWVVGGDFTYVNGASRNRIALLNSDGSLNAGFNPQGGFSAAVNTLAVQADGRIVVGGDFVSFNGSSVYGIARLNSTGALDSTFQTGTGFLTSSYYPSGIVKTLALQNNGQILAGGIFDSFNSTNAEAIARLNADGSLDTAFNTANGFSTYSSYIKKLSLQSDGKIVVGGGFSYFGQTSARHMLKLTPNGDLDTTFSAGSNFSSALNCFKLQSSGSIIAASPSSFMRLNPNGSLDTQFTGFNDDVLAATDQSDGKILAFGSFLTYNNQPCGGVARLNSNGTLDTSFSVPDLKYFGTDDDFVHCKDAFFLSDGRLVLVGPSAVRDGIEAAGLVILEPSNDPSPSPSSSSSSSSGASTGGGGGGAVNFWTIALLVALGGARLCIKKRTVKR